MPTRRPWRHLGTSFAAVLGVATLTVATSAVTPSGAQPAPRSSLAGVKTFTPTMNVVGTVNLTAVAAAQARRDRTHRTVPGLRWRSVDRKVASYERAHGVAKSVPAPSTLPVTTTNVKGESGFVGLTGKDQAQANAGLDLEPPDQGLCAGQGDVGEFINNAFSLYEPDGVQLLPAIGSPAIFLQPSTAFFSDPRCYYDAPTQRWFLQEFIVGTTKPNGSEASPSLQFIAVSDTSDPAGSYVVWSIDTTDTAAKGCPCFGDYDQMGADANGYYIATDEFGISTPAYNGSIIYAISKQTLEAFDQTGIPPVPVGYRLTSDDFGQPYIVSPTSTPQGALSAPGTEYFVESNGDAASGNHLVVYALHDTSLLAQPGVPKLYVTEAASESYAFPPDAIQKPGPIPLGRASQDPLGQIEADFDAVMETTYVNGTIYAELDTATASGSDAAAWFVLKPTLNSGGLTAVISKQGYVAAAKASLIYPDIAVDKAGHGYMLFALMGRSNYPSAAYVAFGPTGPSGSIVIAYPGAAPEDGFTCYAAWVGPNYGGCRWGDYSMGVFSGSSVVMATEMVPPSSRDTLTNWGTYVWNAPPQAG